MRHLLVGLLALFLTAASSAQETLTVVPEVLVRFPGGGAGIVISADGLVAVPVALAQPGTVQVAATNAQVKVVKTRPGDPFGLLRLSAGSYHTLGLGDCSLLQDGDEVRVWSPSGVAKIKVKTQATDVATNDQFLTLETPYNAEFLGWPVLDSNSQVVALVTGPETDRPDLTRATSVQELKLLLFNEGLPPLVSRPSPSLGGVSLGGPSVRSDGTLSPSQVLEWDFPLGSGSEQRPGDLIRLKGWRENTGFQGSHLTPLVVDADHRLYLTTFQGTLYCLDVANKQLLWRSQLGPEGIVLSAPVLCDGRVLVSNGNLDGLSLGRLRTGLLFPDLITDVVGRAHNSVTSNFGQIYAFHSSTGEELWRLPTRFPSPPLVDGKTLYVSGLGLIGAVDTALGKYQWVLDQRQRGSQALWYSLQERQRNVLYGLRVPVALHGGLESEQGLHFRADDKAEVIAIDGLSGEELWSTELPGTSHVYQPLGAKLHQDGETLHVIVGSWAFGIDDTNGKIVYSYRRNDRGLLDRLTINGGVVYGAEDEGWYAVATRDGRRLWYYPAPTPEAAPLVRDGVVYGASHHSLLAIDAASGKKLWEHTFSQRLSGQPTMRDEYLYCASMEGKIWRITLP